MVDAPPPSDLPSNASELIELVAECVERYEDEGEAAIDEVCARHPALRPILRRRLDKLRSMGLLGVDPPTAVPDRLGEYELLEQLGAGGMGVVYRARQQGLDREVALKIVRLEQLYFGESRGRFQREVSAVARLQHPGIVPVHTVGEEHGIPYFTMEKVDGSSLDDVLDRIRARGERPQLGEDFARALSADFTPGDKPDEAPTLFQGSWEDTCIRIARAMADALTHAHRRGIVHRDVKPSNIMVTPDGRVLLMDFGLASSSGSVKLTGSGTRLGSLAYMSPEQARGEPLDERTDIYSLGATLYELLTLRPPYGTGEPHRLISRISAGELTGPRSHVRSLSWEAETACVVALDVDKNRRYASGSDFARDLDHVLERRPLEARRPSAWRRIHRWIQRHPAASVALCLGVLVLVGGPTAFALHERDARQRIARENRVATESFKNAIAAVQNMSNVALVELSDVPYISETRRRLLEDALALYDQLAALETNDLDLLRQRAAAQRAGGRIALSLGQLDDATRHARAAVQQSQALLDRTSEDHDRFALAQSLTSAATIYGDSGALEEACGHSTRAIALLGSLSGSGLGVFDWRAEARRAHAINLDRLGHRDEARTVYELALKELDAIDSQVMENSALLQHRIHLCSNLANHLIGDQRRAVDEAEQVESLLRTGLAASDRLETLVGGTLGRADRLSREVTRNNLAGLYRRGERLDEARSLYLTSLSHLEAMVEQFPALIAPRNQLATVLNNLGLLSIQEGDDKAGFEWYDRSSAELLRITRRDPDNPEVQARLSVLAFNISTRREQLKQWSEGEQAVLRALDHIERALVLAPETDLYHWYREEDLGQLARFLVRQERFEEAQEALEALSEDGFRDEDHAFRILRAHHNSIDLITLLDGWSREECMAEGDNFALACLEVAQAMIDEGWLTLEMLRTDPRFGLLRTFPSFKEFLDA